jgi:hypothetical protein
MNEKQHAIEFGIFISKCGYHSEGENSFGHWDHEYPDHKNKTAQDLYDVFIDPDKNKELIEYSSSENIAKRAEFKKSKKTKLC